MVVKVENISNVIVIVHINFIFSLRSYLEFFLLYAAVRQKIPKNFGQCILGK